jgi:hypothetical protein
MFKKKAPWFTVEPFKIQMKSPDQAAALLALPLIFAVLGVVFCMNNASGYTVSVNGFSASATIGNTQISTAQVSVNPGSQMNLRISGPCPGEDQCVSGGAQPDAPAICMPSSAWALIVVNQLFASVAIILQAAVTAALCVHHLPALCVCNTLARCMRRGTQMIHQCVSFIALICLILSVATVMAVPRRIFDVCVAAISPSASVSYYMNLGGERGRCNFSSIYSPVEPRLCYDAPICL